MTCHFFEKGKKEAPDVEERQLKLPKTIFQQLEVMVSDQDKKGRLREKILRPEEQEVRNQWISREEVRQMSRLLDLPVSAARLHRAPKKKLQPHPQPRRKRRITMTLLKEPGQAILVDESKEDMKRPKRSMTLFVREKRVTKKPEDDRQYLRVHPAR